MAPNCPRWRLYRHVIRCHWSENARRFRAIRKVAASGLSSNDLICFLQGLRTPLRHLLDMAQLFEGLFLLKQTASLRSAVLRQLIALLEYETKQGGPSGLI
jgi:hypothetical protein